MPRTIVYFLKMYYDKCERIVDVHSVLSVFNSIYLRCLLHIKELEEEIIGTIVLM